MTSLDEKIKKNILIVGSGLSAKDIKLYNENLFTIVAVNNGYLITENWDYWVHTNDFAGTRPNIKNMQREIKNKDYEAAMNNYGGIKACGYSIMLNASYWTLSAIKPEKIYYLGADMNYQPDESGNTHIYGIGYDIKKNKISDPDLMIKRYSNGDENFLKKIYNRFYDIAKSKNTQVWNLSRDERTRLPFPKVSEMDRHLLLKK